MSTVMLEAHEHNVKPKANRGVETFGFNGAVRYRRTARMVIGIRKGGCSSFENLHDALDRGATDWASSRCQHSWGVLFADNLVPARYHRVGRRGISAYHAFRPNRRGAAKLDTERGERGAVLR